MNKFLKIISVVTLLLFLRTSMALCADQVYFYYTDPAGTPLAMSDASGTVVWRADYMPFGEESIGTQTVQNNKMFVGKEKDSESGLYYFGARYMDAGAGRFASSDPVGAVNPHTGEINHEALYDPQRLNLYSYAGNNPYKNIDPDGNSYFSMLGLALRQWGARLGPVLTRIEQSVAAALESGKIDRSVTVLGKYPDYLKVADKIGAKRFNIPPEVWNQMSKEQQWAANQKFLDRAIARGDDIILSNPVKDINKITGSFRKELDYLVDKGFKLSEDGKRMISD